MTADQLRNLDNNVNTTEFQAGMLRYLSNEKFDLDPTVVRGCATQWSWNSYKEQTTDRFKHKLLYTHFHAGNKAAAQDSIMALAMVKLPSAAAYDHDQLYVRTIKASAKDFQDADLFDNERNLSLLHIRPVVAGAKVLTAAEVNSVLDGKGTLDFTAQSTTPGYKRENVENKKGFKYTIFKHNSDEALTVYNNPFDSTWLAVESPLMC